MGKNNGGSEGVGPVETVMPGNMLKVLIHLEVMTVLEVNMHPEWLCRLLSSQGEGQELNKASTLIVPKHLVKKANYQCKFSPYSSATPSHLVNIGMVGVCVNYNPVEALCFLQFYPLGQLKADVIVLE